MSEETHGKEKKKVSHCVFTVLHPERKHHDSKRWEGNSVGIIKLRGRQ